MRSIEVLESAAQAVRARYLVYGDPQATLRCAAELKRVWRAYAGDRHAPEHDEAVELALTKLARIACGAFHEDNYTDAAAYLALACEAAGRPREGSADER